MSFSSAEVESATAFNLSARYVNLDGKGRGKMKSPSDGYLPIAAEILCETPERTNLNGCSTAGMEPCF
jgi:hypothetical protein